METLNLRLPIARSAIRKQRRLRSGGIPGTAVPVLCRPRVRGPRAVAGAVETRITIVRHAWPGVLSGLSVLVPQALLLARAPHALRWRLETFGLYMPSLPAARPWWRPSVRALHALCRQLPGYARWLEEMQVLRQGGARGWWRHRTGTNARDWEEWLALALQDTDE